MIRRAAGVIGLFVLLSLCPAAATQDPWTLALHHVRMDTPQARLRAADELKSVPGTDDLQRRLRSQTHPEEVLAWMEQLERLRHRPVDTPDRERIASISNEVLSQPEYDDAKRNARWMKDVLEQLAWWANWLLTRPTGVGGTLAWLAVWILLVAAVVAITLTAFTWVQARFRGAKAVEAPVTEAFAPRQGRDWFAAALAHMQTGDLRMAVQLAFKAILARVHEGPALVYDDRLTHREMQARLERAGFAPLSAALGRARRLFEPVWYGGVQPDMASWNGLADIYRELDVQG